MNLGDSVKKEVLIKRSPRLTDLNTVASLWEFLRPGPLEFQSHITTEPVGIVFSFRLVVPQEFRKSRPGDWDALFEGGGPYLENAINDCYEQIENHERDHKKTFDFLLRVLKKALNSKSLKSIQRAGYPTREVEKQLQAPKQWKTKRNQPNPFVARWAAKRFRYFEVRIRKLRRRYEDADIAIAAKKKQIESEIRRHFPTLKLEKALGPDWMADFVNANFNRVPTSHLAYQAIHFEANHQGRDLRKLTIRSHVRFGDKLLWGLDRPPILYLRKRKRPESHRLVPTPPSTTK